MSLIYVQVLGAIVTGALTIFISFYIAYASLCLIIIKKNRKKSMYYRCCNLPSVSLIIPVFNEATVLPQKFANLERLNYPKSNLEVIFVDGGSEDSSAGLIDNYITNSRVRMLLIKEGRRMGFNSAVITGLIASTGEVICVTGAETEFDPEALRILVTSFSDPKVGAVSGRVKAKNSTGLVCGLEASYRKLYDLLREAESYIDSPFDIKGEISAVRRKICVGILSKPNIALRGNIDCCFIFQSKECGFRGKYEPNAVYSEVVPSSISDSFKQQTRRAATLMENVLMYRNLLLNPEMGYFGTLIMPVHVVMLMILPTLFIFSICGSVALVFLGPFNLLYFSMLTIGTILLSISSYFQAFVKTQMSMFAATIQLIFGVETQKFARLPSARVS